MRRVVLEKLKRELEGAERIAVLAVGSELRGDDVAGMLVGQRLAAAQNPKLRVFLGSTAPENCTGPIKQLDPTHLLIVDAADLGQAPGSIELLNSDQLGGISFTTHALPLSLLIDYIRRSVAECRVMVLGIQPDSVTFGAEPTASVVAAAGEIAAELAQASQ